MSSTTAASQGSSSKKWKPLESNPEVMNKYLDELGIVMKKSPLEMCDVFGLDPELLMMVPQPCAALLLVFPINAASEKYNAEVTECVLRDQQQQQQPVKEDDDGSNQEKPTTTASLASNSNNGGAAYFMKQTIGNACGTIALLHAIVNNQSLFNVKDGTVRPDSFMHKFLEETKSMNPDERAAFVEGNETLEKTQAVATAEGQTAVVDDVFTHFVCFTRAPDGTVVELDGRKPFAIPHGKAATQEEFLSVAGAAAKKFIELAGEDALTSLAMTALAAKQQL